MTVLAKSPFVVFVTALCGVLSSAGCGDGATSAESDAGLSASASSSSGGGGGSSDGGSGPDASDSDAAANQPSIEIVNLTWGFTTWDATANFVLRNHADVAIESVEGIEISIGAQQEPAIYTVDFGQAGFDSKTCAAWTIGPGKRSGVIEIVMYRRQQECTSSDPSSCTNWWTIDVPCDADRVLREVFPRSTKPRSPMDDSPITIRLRGLLSDGVPWSTTATGPFRD